MSRTLYFRKASECHDKTGCVCDCCVRVCVCVRVTRIPVSFASVALCVGLHRRDGFSVHWRHIHTAPKKMIMQLKHTHTNTRVRPRPRPFRYNIHSHLRTHTDRQTDVGDGNDDDNGKRPERCERCNGAPDIANDAIMLHASLHSAVALCSVCTVDLCLPL